MVLYFNFYLLNNEQCDWYHSIADKISFLLMYNMLRIGP